MSVVVVLPLAFGGLSLIGLSMHRHARDAGLTRPRPWLRGAGWAQLLFSLAAVLMAPNWRFALVEWAGLATVAAGLVVLVLHWRPRLLPVLAAASGLIGIAACLIRLILV